MQHQANDTGSMALAPPLSPADLCADRPLLPNEPRVRDWPREQDLTERHLLPALAQLEAFFLWLRADLDRTLCPAAPVKRGKPYPLGQCLEISLAAKARLSAFDASTLRGAPAQGWAALAAFLAAGGTLRQVWGDLRGEYFQNAFLAGTLYIDISNDTVVASKPKVEIRPFAEARFGPVRDHLHYVAIARRYWSAWIFPNHILPDLAHCFPAITAIPGVGLQLESTSYYMIALSLSDGFRGSEAVLQAPPLSADLFGFLRHSLAGHGVALPSSPAAGRALALQTCETHRRNRWQEDRTAIGAALQSALATNRRLGQVEARLAA